MKKGSNNNKKTISDGLKQAQKETLALWLLSHSEENEREAFLAFCDLVQIKNEETREFQRFNEARWMPTQRIFAKRGWFAGNKFNIVLKARRQGTTTICLVRNLWFALTKKGQEVQILGQDEETTKYLFRRQMEIYENLRLHFERVGLTSYLPSIKSDLQSREFVAFSNASEIHAKQALQDPKKAEMQGQGKTISRLHCSEISRYKDARATLDGYLKAAKHAKEIDIESTPFGAGGYFYERYKDAETGIDPIYTSHFIPFYENPEHRLPVPEQLPKDFRKPKNGDQHEDFLINVIGIDDGQLLFWRNEIRRNKLSRTLQSYPIDSTSCFRMSSNSWVQSETLDEYALLNSTNPPAYERKHFSSMGFFIREMPREGGRYLIGADASHGLGQDNSAAYVLDARTGLIVAFGAEDWLSPTAFAKVLFELGMFFNKALIIPEKNNSAGTSLLQALYDGGYPNLYLDPKSKDAANPYWRFGWCMDVQTRPIVFNTLKAGLEEKAFVYLDEGLLSELQTLHLNPKTSKIEALSGCKDDRVIAFGLALAVYHQAPSSNIPMYTSIKKLGSSVLSGIGRFSKQISR